LSSSRWSVGPEGIRKDQRMFHCERNKEMEEHKHSPLGTFSKLVSGFFLSCTLQKVKQDHLLPVLKALEMSYEPTMYVKQ